LSRIEKAKEAEREADPATTIDGLIEVYAAKHLSKLKSGEDVRKLLYREVRPAWGTIPTALVTRRDVIELLDEVEDHTMGAHTPEIIRPKSCDCRHSPNV
jgi:hypothetical protein